MALGYNHAHKRFTYTDDNGVAVDVPFGFKDEDVNGAVFTPGALVDYEVIVVHKKDIPELEYREVRVNTGVGGGAPVRIGWLIPVALVTTDDPAIIALPHINDYIFIAYCYLINQSKISDRLLAGEDLGYTLDVEYSDAALLIINKSRIPANITIKRLELSLAYFGYFQAKSKHLNVIAKNNNTSNTLVLTPCKEILKADGKYRDDYIEDFLTKYAGEDNAFFKFFYLYQIVEVLLDKELIVKLEDYVNLLKNNKATLRKYDTLMKNSTESDRFKAVVDNAGMTNQKFDNLVTLSNKFTDTEDTPQAHPECIYQVRNHVMHRFRKAVEDEVLLSEICEEIEIYLYQLLINYKAPKANG